MRKKLPIVPLVISAMLGLATYFFVFDYLNQMQNKQKVALEEKMQVINLPEYKIVVAKAPINEYDAFTPTNIDIVTLKGQIPPKNIFSDPKELEGKFALRNIEVDNIIQKSDVIGIARPKSIQDLVPVGMRAVSIKIKDTVLEFIQPGDKVDLMADFTDDAGEKYNKIVLQNILVLAKGSRIDGVPAKDDKSAGGANADMLTVALTIRQAEAISALAARTPLKVAWRSDKDEKFADTQGTSAKFLVGDKKSPKELVKNKFIY